MTGTGIQTDPYVVDNWNDFVQAAAIENAYVKFADGGGTIDMNDICPEGLKETVTINAVVDGNGWNIKNLHIEETTAFSVYNKIERLDFVDFYISQNGNSSVNGTLIQFNKSTNTRGILKQCKLSGIVSGNYASVVRGIDNSLSPFALNRCSVNLRTLSDGRFDNYLRIPCKNCIFEIDDSAGTASHYAFNDPIFYDCLIKGKYQMLSINAYSKNVIIDAECQNQVHGGKAAKTQCFIGNKDKAQFDDLFYSVTTDQLKDAAYLASLGFPIGVD